MGDRKLNLHEKADALKILEGSLFTILHESLGMRNFVCGMKFQLRKRSVRCRRQHGDLTMSQKNVYKWYKDFKEGRERVDDLECPGRPSTSTDEQHVNQIKELVHINTALVLRDHFAKNSTNIVPQPPNSPDLSQCDFWLFPKLKRPLRGHRFDTIEEIQGETKKVLKAFPEIEFNMCFDDWKKRWHKCIISGGDYFERDQSDLDK